MRVTIDVDVVALYESGLSLNDVGAVAGVSGGTVLKRLKAAGIPRRPDGGRRTVDPRLTDEWLTENFVRLHRPVNELAAELGCSKRAVYVALRGAGLGGRYGRARTLERQVPPELLADRLARGWTDEEVGAETGPRVGNIIKLRRTRYGHLPRGVAERTLPDASAAREAVDRSGLFCAALELDSTPRRVARALIDPFVPEVRGLALPEGFDMLDLWLLRARLGLTDTQIAAHVRSDVADVEALLAALGFAFRSDDAAVAGSADTGRTSKLEVA